MSQEIARESGPSTGRRLPRALSPFRSRAYRRLAAAMSLVTFASGVWIVALVWEVIRVGGGPGQLSVVSTAGAAGTLIPALLAGVVADRVPQKWIMIAVTANELISMGVISLLSLNGLTRLWHLAVAALVIGMGLAFAYPAYSAWLPALVPESDLLAVNGFEGMMRPTLNQAVGPGVAGMVVGAASPGAAFAVAAGASLVGLAALTVVPRTPVRGQPTVSDGAGTVAVIASALRDVREGFVYMVRTPWLLATLLFASLLVLTMMGPFEVLIPFVIKDRLGGDAGDHAAVLAAFGIGGALASLVMASRPMPRRYLTFMNLMWGIGCLPLALIGLVGEVWMVVVIGFVLGAAFSAPMVIWGTLLQRRVPAHLLGRVSSLDFFVSISLMPVSMALAGPVSEWIGLRTTFAVAGLVPGVISIVAIVWARLPQDELAHPLRD